MSLLDKLRGKRVDTVIEALLVLLIQKGIINDVDEFVDLVESIEVANKMK